MTTSVLGGGVGLVNGIGEKNRVGILRRKASAGGSGDRRYAIGTKDKPTISPDHFEASPDAESWGPVFAATAPYGIPEIYSPDQGNRQFALSYWFAPLDARPTVETTRSLSGLDWVRLPEHIGGSIEPLREKIIEELQEDIYGRSSPIFSTGHIKRAVATGLCLAGTFRQVPPRKTLQYAEKLVPAITVGCDRDEAILLTALAAGKMSAVVPSEQDALDILTAVYGLGREQSLAETACDELDLEDESSFNWVRIQMTLILTGKYIPYVASFKTIAALREAIADPTADEAR